MITVNTLFKMKSEGEKITMLTAYDASLSALLDRCGLEIILVGDSLGMVIQGNTSTLSVSLEDMCYHTKCVAKGAKQALILADMPFGGFLNSPEDAFIAACELMKAGAHMVKIEGGAVMAPVTQFLQERGIPVCAHIGLTPQYVNKFGGYKVQGKTDAAAEQLIIDAQLHENAGASLVLMECVPHVLAKTITDTLNCPTIGIGAGLDCDGQVLVMHDMLGIFPGKTAKFVKNFMIGQTSIEAAINAYITEVKSKTFPALEHTF